VRDHLLGVTFVTGDGRLVQSGARDEERRGTITKLAAGGFGAFGVIVLVHLRLRASRAPTRRCARRSREDLTQVPTTSPRRPSSPPRMSSCRRPRAARALDVAVRFAGSRPGLRRRSGAPCRHRRRFTALRADEATLWMRAPRASLRGR